jgi:hypothetical protein
MIVNTNLQMCSEKKKVRPTTSFRHCQVKYLVLLKKFSNAVDEDIPLGDN